MVMNKTSSINGQFGNNSINNNGPNNNGHLISNGKSANSQVFGFSHDAQRIEHYKASIEIGMCWIINWGKSYNITDITFRTLDQAKSVFAENLMKS